MAHRQGERRTPTEAHDTASRVMDYATKGWQRLRSTAGEWTGRRREDDGRRKQSAAEKGRTRPAVAAKPPQMRSNPGAPRSGTDNAVAPPPTRPTPNSATPTHAAHQQVGGPAR